MAPRTSKRLKNEHCITFEGYAVLVAWVVSLSAPTAGERTGNNLNDWKDFRSVNGPIQGRNLALTVLCVPCSLVSGAT